ncbi:ethylene-responsive transcription factor 5-like [Alnus glutinosa]|uniref:ethylene-responsive transcription factor 5-like n=1 Tax=Alnus glutinosa TaxID=3517 RepID=UPI002D78DD69|nr:ethylene-responsive transcription factor 5-like [Alnus glutinosa]
MAVYYQGEKVKLEETWELITLTNPSSKERSNNSLYYKKNTEISRKLTIRPIQKTHPLEISNNQPRIEDLAPEQKQNRVDPIREPKCTTSTFPVRSRKPKCRSEKHYRGVRQRSGGKYEAEIQDPIHRSLCMWLGTFDMAIEAVKAYDRAAFKLHGSKAILKFPLEVENMSRIWQEKTMP